MEIHLYKNYDEVNRINKTLTDEIILTGSLKDNANIMSPSIMFETNITLYNYCYIPQFNRYYFIKDVIIVRNKAYIANMEVDVLMSFKNEILELSGIVSRLTDGNKYADRTVLYSKKKEFEKIAFPNNVFTNDGTYVLVAQGGVVSG